MNLTYECGDHGALIGYLYDESDEAQRVAIESHLKMCAACTEELAALDLTRVQLASWMPPERKLDFRVVRKGKAVGAGLLRRWAAPLPVWVQAAAAVVIFGTGLALGVARGTGQEATTGALTSARPATAASSPTGEVTRGDLAALEQRLRAELFGARSAESPVSTGTTASASVADAQVLARVRALIDESEQRQRRELALRTAEVVRDIDAQRQFDWVRVQRALGEFQGTAGAEIQRHEQEINNLLQRVSQRPQ